MTKMKKGPTNYETQTFPEPGRELCEEVVRETGGRTGASDSGVKYLKNFLLHFTYLLCMGGINTSWCALEVRGQFGEPLLSFHHACLPSG